MATYYDPLADTDTANASQLNKRFESLDAAITAINGIPVGAVMAAGHGTIPTGWLLCDGSAVSRVDHSLLFAAIGTAFGAGDGSSTFNLPDLRGRTPIGAGTGSGLTARTLGQTLGEEDHQLSIAEMAAHTHQMYASNVNSAAGAASFDMNLSGSTGSAGSDTAHNNMQPTLIANYIIRG